MRTRAQRIHVLLVLVLATMAALTAARAAQHYPSGQIVQTIDHSVSTTTITGNTETTIYTYSVPGGTLLTSNCLRVSMRGHITTALATPGTATVRVKYGATTFTVVNATNLTPAATNVLMALDFLFTAAGATNSQKIHSIFNDNTGVTAITSIAHYNTSSVDSTTAQTLAITWQFSATTNTFMCDSTFTEVLQ